MNTRTFARKAAAKTRAGPLRRAHTGGNAAALAPPSYGIDFADRADDGGSAAVHAAAARGTQGAGGPLPYLDTIQKSFGKHDVTGVRAHTGAEASGAAAAMGAEAFAFGNKVAFARAPSLGVAAHEAAHVVQQRAGVHLKGGVGQSGDAYERHADAVAERVVRGESAETLLDSVAVNSASGAPAVQRSVGFEIELRAGDWNIWVPAARGPGKTAPEKATPVVYGKDFQLQAEYGGANLAIAELVTNEPGLQTREQFEASVGDMQRLGRELDKKPSNTAMPADDFAGGDPNFVMEKKGNKTIDGASLQVTVGVPLASVPALFKKLEGIVPKHESGVYAQARERAEKISKHHSNDYKGLMVLLHQYLSQTVGTRPTEPFVKGLIKVMARTDFHAMFATLPDADSAYIVKQVDLWLAEMLSGKDWKLEGRERLVAPTITDTAGTDPAMQITTTRADWLRTLPKTDLLTYEGRGAKTAEVAVLPGRSPQKIMKEMEDLIKVGPPERLEALKREYAAATAPTPENKEFPLGKPQSPERHYGVTLQDRSKEEAMLDAIETLYEGLGKLGGKMDFIEYADEPAPKDAPVDAKNYSAAPILEIRNPPPAGSVDNWSKVAKTIYDAVEESIQYPNGRGLLTKPRNFRNVLTPGQIERGVEAQKKAAKLKEQFQILEASLDQELAPGEIAKGDGPAERIALRELLAAAHEAAENRMGMVRRHCESAEASLPKARWTTRLREVDRAIDELVQYQSSDKKSVGAGNLYKSAYDTLKRFGVAI